jgi:hypothetical protein
VANAIELGVYVIIDWHDHEAIAHRTQAQEFLPRWPRSTRTCLTFCTKCSTNLWT